MKAVDSRVSSRQVSTSKRRGWLGLAVLLQVCSLVGGSIDSAELRRSAAAVVLSPTASSDDRLLFWSSYDFNIDAAAQLFGPLDLLMRGGASAGDEPSEGDSSSATATLDLPLRQDQDITSTATTAAPTTTHLNASKTTTTTLQDEGIARRSTTTTSSSNATATTTAPSQPIIHPMMSNGAAVPKLNYTLFQPGDGSETDPDGIPTRFVNMHPGDRRMAQQSLEATLEWRATHQIDDILNEPQRKFDLCKTVFPHYFLGGRDQQNHVVLVQRPALMDLERGRVNNLTEDELLRHYIFVNEYLWQVVERDDALATMVSIIDLQGLHLGVLRKVDILHFAKVFVSTMDSFYPQRAHQTLLLNAPKWFSTLYKLFSPLLRETTKAKIAIHARGKGQDEALKQILDEKALASLPETFWSSWKKKRKRRNGRRRKRNDDSYDDDDDDEDDDLGEAATTPPPSKLEQDLRSFVSCYSVFCVFVSLVRDAWSVTIDAYTGTVAHSLHFWSLLL